MDEWFTIIAWIVLLTASLALLVYLTAKIVEHRNPPIGKFLEIDGTRLHYVERGSGLPVVFLHGNGTMLQDFLISEAFASTSQQYRTIVFDRPGFGYSTRPRGRRWSASDQADLLAGALGQLQCTHAAVVGHSWGTLVAVALAERHPALVRSVVLLSGYFYPAPRFDQVLAAVGTIPIIGDILRYTFTPLIGLLMLPVTLRAMFSPCPVPDRFKNAFPELMMLRPWQLRASLEDGAVMGRSAAGLQRGYRALPVPTFIAAGGDDRIVNDWHSKNLHKEVPESRLEIIPRVGHMVHHSAADRIAAIVHLAARPGTVLERKEPGSEWQITDTRS